MTTNTDERRAKATQRVPLGTLVEICGNEPGIPSFEAESVDVSARGMHVRTAYLPELNAPLVCRFEDQGREIIVEGSVAWRREGARGGEFGIQFTALDASSVEALRDLCGVRTESEPAAPEQADAKNPTGRVRLHIDGLGSPMKARVRGASDRGVQVGSSLEFLKVGRRLEVEDLERGAKREAFIDSVSVAIDPKTQVPQLVVALRYEEAEESTPEPSVIDSEAGATHRSPSERASGGSSAEASTDDDEPEGAAAAEVDDDDLAEEGREMRGRLAVAATNAGAVMQRGGAVLARVSASAAVGVGRLFKGASQKVADYRQRNAQSEAPRRTAPPPSGVLSAEGRHLRRQAAQSNTSESASGPGAQRPRIKRIAVAGGAVALLATVVVIATKSPAPPPGAQAQNSDPAVAVASAENVTQVDEQGNPASGKPAEKADKTAAEPAQGGGISADVPLFGPTPMATMEAAPLGPAPVDDAVPAAAGAAPPADEEAAEKAAAAASVEDESWQGPAAAQKSTARPEDVEPWGRGRMDTPTIHRLRLDGAGAAIQGAITPTGFSVVIPGRKVMETGGGIEKRDQRIAKVRIKNATSGAHVSFQFKDGVPGYRVRLRRDYVEFLVSAPAHPAAESSKSANSSTAVKKSTPTAPAKKNATPSEKANKNVAQKPKTKKS
jgi:hypothetical protein